MCYFDSYGKPRRQSITLDDIILPLRHDRMKYFLNIRAPTAVVWDTCQMLEIESPEPWGQPGCIRWHKSLKSDTDKEIEEWNF